MTAVCSTRARPMQMSARRLERLASITAASPLNGCLEGAASSLCRRARRESLLHSVGEGEKLGVPDLKCRDGTNSLKAFFCRRRLNCTTVKWDFIDCCAVLPSSVCTVETILMGTWWHSRRVLAMGKTRSNGCWVRDMRHWNHCSRK